MKKYTERQKEKDKNIVNYVRQHNIDLNNPMVDRQRKILFLKNGMQYKGLRTKADGYTDTFIPLEECSSARISAVVKKTYFDAVDRLKRGKKLEQQVEIF